MLAKIKENQFIERWKDTPFANILDISWDIPNRPTALPERFLALPDNAIVLSIYNGVADKSWVDHKAIPHWVDVRFEHSMLDIRLHKTVDEESLQPIVIHHHSEAKEPLHIESKVTIRADKGAKASLLFLETGNGTYLSTPEVFLDVSREADIEWVHVSRNSSDSFAMIDFTSFQDEESEFHAVSYQSQGKLSRSNLRMDVRGSHTETNFYGLNLGKEEQHMAYVVDMNHLTPQCESNQQIKNIVKDRAMALFDGKIYIYPDSQEINADQMTRSIVLNDGARVQTNPRLEIYADDVLCTHGAAIGAIDHDQMFYMQSRGLSELEARKLLMRAYAAEVVESIRNESIRTWLEAILDEDILTLL